MAEGEHIQPEDLPAELSTDTSQAGALRLDLPPEGISIEQLERELIIKAMDRSGWIIAKAAPLLGMSYKTLQYRLEKFNIEKTR